MKAKTSQSGTGVEAALGWNWGGEENAFHPLSHCDGVSTAWFGERGEQLGYGVVHGRPCYARYFAESMAAGDDFGRRFFP
ncbi:hypothetical protein NWFMUON74_11910 [Nocardia wallacei]|uniref:Uncharacterized protein n=1 Tax=Nocardia wallacei TaxID=480035 RepID=A0A7G1KHE9_9NOCA|nr:hypothetical protein NWFMUON74_11910 [Nocardia wallacei]